ncbi:hypothetical protein ASPVEDRAFT_23174 [Aspergillus versicolor CBS 583.65]|uniref:Uncharacterized protein n=1 Tax=Aspergillus versicolor CBS 583.65 TaxID=1036611 RepID=A0A1L9P3Q3_ASPVE|nr:uncharacterized protein ASPVEDRAFT_23174 [Aspergillus versicolor CBS 583.65]OJI96149.1 hypothetical protein ASPVEDRAFT_23174 [Aspergillus versicolor CBS 583.65]
MYLASSLGMPLRWRKRPQYPPGPFVEDEIDSLSRELNGSSHAGELPGYEGAKARGTANQSPLILDVEILSASNASSNAEKKPAQEYGTSGFDANQTSSKMDTKQGPKSNPSPHPAGGTQVQRPGKSHSRSSSKSQDVPPVIRPSKPAYAQVSSPQRPLPGTNKEPIPHRPGSTTRAPGPREDALTPKLPPKPMAYVTQKSQAASFNTSTPSLHREHEQTKAAYPPGHSQPEPDRSSGVRINSLARSAPDVTEKGPSVPSRTPSLRRGKELRKSGSPARYTQSEPTRHSEVRTSSPSKRIPDVARQPPSVSSRAPPMRQDEREYIPTHTAISTRAEPTRDSRVPASLSPQRPVSGVAQQPQVFSSQPYPAPQGSQNGPLPVTHHHAELARDTTARGPPLPPKQLSDATRQSQPTAPRPLPTPPDDVQHKPRPSLASYQPETIVQESGVRVEKLPPRPFPEGPKSIQRPLPTPSESIQYKSFPSSIPPPSSSPDTAPLQPLPLRTIPLHPLPNSPAEGSRMPSKSTTKGPGSVQQALPPKQSTADPRPATSGYASKPVTAHPESVPRPLNRSSTLPVEVNSPPSPGLSVAERLEEKLKLRREQRGSGDFSQTAAVQSKSSDSLASQIPDSRAPPVQPPGGWPSEQPSDSPSTGLSQFPTLDHSTGESKPQPKTAPLKSALRSRSLDRSQSASTKIARRRTVAFAETPVEFPSQALVTVDHETALTRLQTDEDGSSNSSRSSSPNTGLTLAPCPRSIPVAGYQDWHTIEGLDHLDICPSCVKQMRKSKFRDRLILSPVNKSRTEPVRCAMSEPWTRLAWMQTLKKKLERLDLLSEVTRPSLGTKSCTGRIISDQSWYRIIDSDTGSYLPQFNVCSACIRNIKLLWPVHRGTFERSSTPQERVCDFVSDSPRFIRYIDALDLSANRAEQEDSKPELKEFLAYARRKVVLRDCRRSRLIFNTWHYMPQLPEFTVCEDCYDDIVWPLAKARHPMARDFSSVMRLLPGDTGTGTREASCQLYSPRIRAKFNDAVRRDDLPFIRWMAMTRYEAEKRFRDRQDELLEDQRRGYDCSGDLRKNLEDWKRYE